ncbi:MAG: hypothetical protein WDK95_09365 [Syntrophorhabdaceae bacterium]
MFQGKDKRYMRHCGVEEAVLQFINSIQSGYIFGASLALSPSSRYLAPESKALLLLKNIPLFHGLALEYPPMSCSILEERPGIPGIRNP